MASPLRVVAAAANPADEAGLSVLGWYGVEFLLLVSLVISVVACINLALMLYAWRGSKNLLSSRLPARPVQGRPLWFSLLVDGQHEPASLGRTLDQLAGSYYSELEVFAIVGDDPAATRVARAAADRYPGKVSVVIATDAHKSKPKALNAALARCTGDVIGVFNAGDEVHPRLLSSIDARLRATGADVVQADVQMVVGHNRWWSTRSSLDHYSWLRGLLPFLADQNFMPLGRQAFFVRKAVLRAAGGWDEECLAEGYQLGVLLSMRGAQAIVAHDAELATRATSPETLSRLVGEHTRWNQGCLQALRKGTWRELPTRRQRLIAGYTLSMPYLQAFTALSIPVAVVLAANPEVPTPIRLLALLPLVPIAITLAVEAVTLRAFGRTHASPIGRKEYVVLVLATLPHHLLLVLVAARALAREAFGRRDCEQTKPSRSRRPPALPQRREPDRDLASGGLRRV